jgi:hypothetical protein
MSESADRIETYRSEFRAALVALGVPLAAIGAWALLAPHSWYEDFPGGGRHWVSALGPYNEHLVRDFGALYLGLGLLLVFAAVVLRRLLAQAALGTLLVFAVPHFVFHLSEMEALSTGDNIVNMTALGLTVLLPALLLWLSVRSRGSVAATGSARAASSSGQSPIEGGMGYGTR